MSIKDKFKRPREESGSGKAKRAAATAADVTALTVGGILRTALRIIMTAVLVFITTALLFACIFAIYVKTTLSTDLDITMEELSLNLSSTVWYQDSDGEYQELMTLSNLENRIWVDYDNIPQDMLDAIVSIEDQRFYEHKGVDWYRTLGAFYTMFTKMDNDFGGSTITQQLIKNVTGEDEGTVARKLTEIFRALELEKNYTKEEILTWYLNKVYFGENCYGIYTAAQTYFGKDVWDLSLAECVSIAGITNNPSRYDPFINTEANKERQETILYEMYDQGYITYDEYTEAVNEELQFLRGEDEAYEQTIYSYYIEVVINDVLADLMEERGISLDTAKQLLYNGGYQIYCCLDPEIQAQVDAVYEDVDNLPRSYVQTDQQLQSAIVIMDPYTGEILALSGGVGEKTSNFGFNRATDAQRACGSSTKPLSVYGPALEYGLITQTTLINDSPDITLSGTSWFPRNSGNTYTYGNVTVRYALAQSLNTISAQIMDKLTPAVSYEYMTERLGFTSLVEADMDYAPLALGEYTYGVTVREMAQAYCSFVNNGMFTYARTYTLVTDSYGTTILDNQADMHTAFSSNTAANICDMLYNAMQTGTGSAANFTTTAVAGKTGTSSNNNDRYFVGFTEYYVAACWTGYDTPETMYFYSNPAVTIWKSIMEPIHEGLEYMDFPTPVIGAATTIFVDEEEPEETEEPEESEEPDETEQPAATEEPEETPTVTHAPIDADEPEVVLPTDPPEPESPVETEAVSSDNTDSETEEW